jgi:hypothetical protein
VPTQTNRNKSGQVGGIDRCLSVLTVRWLRQEGRFAPAIKVGRRLVWDARDVAAWLESQRESAEVA